MKNTMGMLLAALLLTAAAMTAQDNSDAAKSAATTAPSAAVGTQLFGTDMPNFQHGKSYFPTFIRPYTPLDVPPANLSNSPRVDQLIRDGKVMLSLSDAIALAIENNLDVAIQRYNPLIADTDILRTKAGTGGRFVQGPVTSTSGGVGGSTGSGSATGSFDPTLTSTFEIEHAASPVTSFVTRQIQNINSIKTTTTTANFNYTQGFKTGTFLTLGLSNIRQTNVLNTLNPQITSGYQVQLNQHLLQGWGLARNTTGIRVARNNREVSDLVFKEQIIATVATVQSQYWDLVSAQENVKVAERSLQVSDKLYNDNKRQVEIGTLAPIEVVRAEAEVAARNQDLIVARTNLQQLGTSMKNLILRNVSDPNLLTAEVVATDKISVPPVEPVVPVQELIGTALSSRPELAQSRINLTNKDIGIQSSKNAMLPTVDAFGFWDGRGVAGITRPGVPPVSDFTGGLGRVYTQLLHNDFPDYAFGVSLNIPIRNRTAQADAAQLLLDRRQADLRLRQQENQVRVEVVNSLIAAQQNRARIDAAAKQRELAEKSLDAEQKKFQLGASTNFNVIQAQRDLTSALSGEVAALGAYMKSRVEMDRVTGQTVFKNNIQLEEAFQGHLTKLPQALPPTRQD